MLNKTVATSAETAEVKAKPAKVGAEEKILAGIKQAWLELKSSDKSWEQVGRKFGKWCSALRKLCKKPGSRKGQGFEATIKKLGVNFQKARYWADVVDGKVKARNYAGAVPAKQTTTDEKAEPKLKPFTLSGLDESQQDEIVKAVQDQPEDFSRFVYRAAVDPDESQVFYVMIRCLEKLSLSDQVDLLSEVGKWIKKELATLREDIKVGATTRRKARAVAFLDDDKEIEVGPNQLSTMLAKVRELGQPEPSAVEEVAAAQAMAAGAGS